jgi:class 3 adenylate cyclase/tetratricopeptide (TPR) repeat protein
MVGERRLVTMLFCDLAGSTAAAEILDPEEWAEVANQVFELMIAPVYRYEGTVGRLMGDAILAFFGAPIAHEDDPQRAVLAGLDIVAAIQPFREKAAREWGLDINVRVGINTGLVMVGQVGSDLQMEYTAMGDAINLAARMEQTAAPGTVQISQQTHAYVAPFFEHVDLGEVAVKGKSAPIHTYRPLRRKSRTDRMRAIGGLDAPLIGRAAELHTIVKALERLDSGVGGVVCLVGEAGLGKSRLIREAAERIGVGRMDEPSPVAWLETAALSYESARPYALFQRLLHFFWDIAPADEAQVIRDKIARGRPGDAADRQIFEILLGAEAEHETLAREGESYKKELYRTMAKLADEESAKRPLVLVFDDLHWADPASVELVTHLLSLAERRPILLICSMRPDREAPGWQVKQAAEKTHGHWYHEVSLHALTNDEANDLVDNLLSADDLSPASRQRILKKTDGNPLYVEEVIRTLIERELIVPVSAGNGTQWRAVQEIDDADMPGNLQSMLVARIDRLEVEARRTLQLASVIGRSFYYRVLDAIYGSLLPASADLENELITLQRKDLIRQATLSPEPEYIFRHALAQEAAYNTILLRQRQMFHRLTGSAIEELFAEQIDEFNAVLAYHFSRADDPRAVRYATLAGDAAYRIFAIPEALRHYTMAIEILQANSYDQKWLGAEDGGAEGDGGDKLAHLFGRRGRCLELQSDYAGAQENFADMERLARERDDRALLLAALQSRATSFAIPSVAQNAERAQSLADEALILARQLGDQRAEARILWIFMLIKLFTYSMVEGIPFGEQSAALARQLDMKEQLAQSLQDLARCYLAAERLDKARSVLNEARPLLQTLNNLPTLAENLSVEAQLLVFMARFDEAIEISDNALAIATSIDNAWGQVTARSFVGLVYLARGEIDQALEVIQAVIAGGEQEGHPARGLGWFYLGWVNSQLGAESKVAPAAERGLESAVDHPQLRSLGLALLAWRSQGTAKSEAGRELLSVAGQPGERKTILINDLVSDLALCAYYLDEREYVQAEQFLDALVLRLRESGVRYFLPYALHLKSRTLKAMGRAGDARETLEKALETSVETENRIVQWQILGELGEGEAAEEIVHFISDNISDSELRVTFQTYARSTIGK